MNLRIMKKERCEAKHVKKYDVLSLFLVWKNSWLQLPRHLGCCEKDCCIPASQPQQQSNEKSLCEFFGYKAIHRHRHGKTVSFP